MAGFPIIPIIFLLFALYSSFKKKSRKNTEMRDAPLQPMEEDRNVEVFETAEQPFQENSIEKYDLQGNLRESEVGTKAYKEQYDFEKKKRVSQFEEVEKSSQMMDISAKQGDLKINREIRSSGEGLKCEEKSSSTPKIFTSELKRELFSDPKLLQKAFIMKEILDKPVSLRCGSGRKSEG